MFRRLELDQMGWPTRQSQWTDGALHWTAFQDYDAFGRVGKVVPPDDPEHVVGFSYVGDRQRSRTVRIASDTGVACAVAPAEETCSTTVETYDRQGRLVQVREPSSPALPGQTDGNVHTSYSYDVAGRLAGVHDGPLDALGVPTASKVRSFEYDGRGLLVAEQHPEKGVGGDGWTAYRYDSRGNLTRGFESIDAAGTSSLGFDVTFSYDRADRLTGVTDAEEGLLKLYEYWPAGAASSVGKLQRATRHNRFGPGGSLGDVVVTEEYFYGGKEARISERHTAADRGSSVLRFAQSWTYTDLGDVAGTSYPCQASASWTCTESAPTVSRSYEQGWLTGIPGYLSSVTWHPNGMLDTITYGSGLTYSQGLDANHLQRPADILDLPFQYDGAGNIKGWTLERMRYDSVSRLKWYSLTYDPQTQTFLDAARQEYSYDRNGNLTGIARANYTASAPQIPPIDPDTNRFSGTLASYDAAGNLTSSPSGVSFEWDPLSSLREATDFGERYVYTADEERIGVLEEGVEEEWTVRDLDGAVLRRWRFDSVPSTSCTPSITIDDTSFAPGSYLYQACNTLAAGPNVTLQSGAQVQLRSGGSVSLRADATGPFAVGSGARLVIGGLVSLGDPGATPLERIDTVTALGYPLVAESSVSGRAYIRPNWLGNRTQVCDDTAPPGTNCGLNILFGYGEELEPGGGAGFSFPSTRLFTDHERDRHGGSEAQWTDDLDYMHARYYSPLYGRFLSGDPVGGDPGRPQSWNRYSYVMGNPTNYIDPYGLVGGSPNFKSIFDTAEQCAADPTCIGFDDFGGGDEPGRGPLGPLFTQRPDPFGFDQPGAGYGGLFDVESARFRLTSTFLGGSGPDAFLAGLGLRTLDVFGVHDQGDLAREIALGAVPIGSTARLAKAISEAAGAKVLLRRGINLASPGGQRLLAHLNSSVADYVGLARQGRVLREIPGEFLGRTVGEAFLSGNKQLRKLLTDMRFKK
jgi:RHS repeat-associated protein